MYIYIIINANFLYNFFLERKLKYIKTSNSYITIKLIYITLVKNKLSGKYI